MNSEVKQHSVQRVSFIAFLLITLLIIASYFTVVHNLRLQNNMLEASSTSYELRILIDQSNEQFSLLFDPSSTENFSDRILSNIRDDFVKTTEQITLMKQRLQGLMVDQNDAIGSFIPSEIFQKINAEISNIDKIWGQFQARIDEVAAYNTLTLKAGNKLWQPIDASIAHNGSLSRSISSLNDLVYQSSVKHNQRLWYFYLVLLVFLVSVVWGVWLFSLKPLATSLKKSYDEILCKNKRLDYQANHDSLTDLFNRAAFNRKVTELESSKDTSSASCLVLIDLDNFKLINDTLGHNVGDLVLQKVAKDLLESPMEGELAFRLGGDEFALWIPHVDNEALLKRRLELVLAKVRVPLVSENHTIETSCSIGAVIASKGADYNHKEMFAVADSMLYEVKESGRDGYELYNETKSASVDEMLQSDCLLREAVEHNEFTVSYQPILEIQSQKVQGFEARVHWNHPDYGQVHHDNWLNDATRLSLDAAITRQVIQSITEHFESWNKDGGVLRPVTVDIGKSILLSGEAFQLLSELAENLPDPALIGIEVSELMFTERCFDAIVERLEQFKSLGTPITVDHYGRGKSSLLQLRKIPFDVIKIDKHLTLKASYDPSLRTYISSLANFTKGIGKKLLCQDIQGKAERHKLLELGCVYMQSRHLSTALSVSEVSRLLRQPTLTESS
ncbi:EAL domain-containing protein [Leucothrix sargassi]|nr:EAL domain-containing protein [Leucothrix sargassi]